MTGAGRTSLLEDLFRTRLGLTYSVPFAFSRFSNTKTLLGWQSYVV